MASTSLDHPGGADARNVYSKEKFDDTAVSRDVDDQALPYSPDDTDSLKPRIDSTHRKLKPRHIQLIGIGGYA